MCSRKEASERAREREKTAKQQQFQLRSRTKALLISLRSKNIYSIFISRSRATNENEAKLNKHEMNVG